MRKFYSRLLLIFIVFILSLNIILSIVTLNPRQLINFAFYDTRVIGIVYLVKDIVVEIGVNIRYTPEQELITIVDEAAKIYNIDRELLLLLIDPKLQYSISLTGGMGLTRINPYTFLHTNYSHPFIAKDNIFAAASVIREHLNNGVHPTDIARDFLIEHLNYDTIRKTSPYTAGLILAITNKYNQLRQDEYKKEQIINIFNIDNMLDNNGKTK